METVAEPSSGFGCGYRRGLSRGGIEFRCEGCGLVVELRRLDRRMLRVGGWMVRCSTGSGSKLGSGKCRMKYNSGFEGFGRSSGEGELEPRFVLWISPSSKGTGSGFETYWGCRRSGFCSNPKV